VFTETAYCIATAALIVSSRSLPNNGSLSNNIEMDLTDIRRESVDKIRLPRDREQWRVLVNMVMNHRVP
jgi:hypothetical protein